MDAQPIQTRHLLLDFDGPICNLFAGLPALSVAAQLQELLRSDGTPLPDHVASEDDPIEVLRFTSSLDLKTAALVETALQDAELAATATATPTPYVRDVLLACHRTGRRVAVISNNSQAAVETTSDIQSAKAASTHSVGYANKPGKHERLQDAGADAVVTSMDELHTTLLAHRPSS